MKRLIIVTIVIVVLMSFGLIGFLPGILADPPEGKGAPANIVSPLDEYGNVKVSVDGAVEVTASTPVPVHEQGIIQVTQAGPVSVTAAAPLPVVLPPSPGPQIIKIIDDGVIIKGPSSPPAPPPILLSDWQDVKAYSKFKIYIKIKPGPALPPPGTPVTSPTLYYSVIDSAGEGELGFVNIGGAQAWNLFPDPPSGTYWATTYYFEGLYSEVSLSMYYPGPDGEASYNVNAWLLMGN